MKTTTDNKIRLDYSVILDMVNAGSSVLDLGCGDGELLSLLIESKGCRGRGIEIDEKAVFACIARGLTISHEDINYALAAYTNKTFDYVIMNESLQQITHPQQAVLEALRVGRHVIVGMPNFCHFLARFQIFFQGRVPVTRELPYQWYETPNIRFFSLKDFKAFCRKNQITIRKQTALGLSRIVPCCPNMFAHFGIFLLEN